MKTVCNAVICDLWDVIIMTSDQGLIALVVCIKVL